ncbi:MAG TPA: hypothetical protein VE800_02660 [Actinomycetota bacterium]|nr:hypothetical protein [Actinomycetota bacterium]
MGRAPNEMPGRPGGKVVPTWSDNDDVGAKADRRRAVAEWRQAHPAVRWWRRMLRRRSGPGA